MVRRRAPSVRSVKEGHTAANEDAARVILSDIAAVVPAAGINMRLIDLPIDQARAVKWQRGREQYGGPVFVGHPLEELDGELLDAMNYAKEAVRQGFPMAGVAEDLRSLCERTRAIHHAGWGTTDKDIP